MSNIDAEEAQFQKEVEQVKQWWTDSRWRFTRRPFTAEQIVAKRGNLTITYPSNNQSKKLWNIVEGRFKVRRVRSHYWGVLTDVEQRCELHIRLSRPGHGHPNGEVLGYRIRFWVAMFVNSIIH